VVLNTIASQNAAARDHQRRLKAVEEELPQLRALGEQLSTGIAYLDHRLETVRKEMLFEITYGPGPTASRDIPEPELVDPDLLQSVKDEVKLNLGAGHVLMSDHLNVDVRQLPGIDIVADVRKLPFGPGEVTEVFSAHLLEHFPIEEMRRSVLPYWVSLLRDGGRFVAVVPDMETMAAEFIAERIPPADFIEVVYGGQEYAGDFHFAGFTRGTLTALLEEAGLSEVAVVESGRRNGMCYEMEVHGVRRMTAEKTPSISPRD
jgi:predicted SAM-dependent methyltransferase